VRSNRENKDRGNETKKKPHERKLIDTRIDSYSNSIAPNALVGSTSMCLARQHRIANGEEEEDIKLNETKDGKRDTPSVKV
jgi:hypothetical protein